MPIIGKHRSIQISCQRILYLFAQLLRYPKRYTASDRRADFVFVSGGNAFSNGTNTIPLSDGNWNNAYSRIRATNYLIEKASSYTQPNDIKQFVAEAKFLERIRTLTCCNNMVKYQLLLKP
jgi:hypothetical protein